eukprot:gene2158-1327_t
MSTNLDIKRPGPLRLNAFKSKFNQLQRRRPQQQKEVKLYTLRSTFSSFLFIYLFIFVCLFRLIQSDADVGQEEKYDGQFKVAETAAGMQSCTRIRDPAFFATLRHIQRIPAILMDLEFYLALTCFGLAENLMALVLLPIKVVLWRRRVSSRDVVGLALMVVCMSVFWACSHATTQLYSYLYHAVRRTSFLKLVMIFSILDVADKALSSLTQDTQEVFYAAVEDYWARRPPAAQQQRKEAAVPATISPLVALLDSPMQLAPPLQLSVAGANAKEDPTPPRGSVSPIKPAAQVSKSADSTQGGAGPAFVTASRWEGPPCPVAHEESSGTDAVPPTHFSLWLLCGTGLAAAGSVALHALCLLLVAVTLNVAINADANSLLALLISNNFNELKSTIFKKYTPESLHSVCVVDAIERLQYVILFFVICMQYVGEKFNELAILDAIAILSVEVLIDFAKLLFCCRFNGIPSSVLRSYTELSLLDLASEKVIWKFSSVAVRVVHPAEPIALSAAPPVGKLDPVSAALLRPCYGFSPKSARRAGFDAVAYAAVVLWSLLRVAGHLFQADLVVFVLFFVVLCLLKLLISVIVEGVATRYVVRALLEGALNLQTTPSSRSMPTGRTSRRQRLSTILKPAAGVVRLVPSSHPQQRSSQGAACENAAVESEAKNGSRSTPRAGPSPSAPRRHPAETTTASRSRSATPAAAPDPPKNGASPGDDTWVLRLTPLLCALLRADRFDLQAGKKKATS